MNNFVARNHTDERPVHRLCGKNLLKQTTTMKRLTNPNDFWWRLAIISSICVTFGYIVLVSIILAPWAGTTLVAQIATIRRWWIASGEMPHSMRAIATLMKSLPPTPPWREGRLKKPLPSLPSVANEGFAPLCGAAATPVAALKTPVAQKGRGDIEDIRNTRTEVLLLLKEKNNKNTACIGCGLTT